jgi:hypothetical protein
MCKTLDTNTNAKLQRLDDKHGSILSTILRQYSTNEITELYGKYPDIKMNLFDLENELKQQNIVSTIAPPGFSMDALFTTENKNFRYEQSVKHFTDMLLTGPNSLFNKIQYFCKINGSRVFSSSNPLTIMMVLPENNVNERAEAYEILLKTSQFHVINIKNKSLDLNKKNMTLTSFQTKIRD